jgi:hypothetical protein
MATYKEIQDYVEKKHGCSVKTCWIAHVKELEGLPLREAPNRESEDYRTNPFPENKKPLAIWTPRKMRGWLK